MDEAIEKLQSFQGIKVTEDLIESIHAGPKNSNLVTKVAEYRQDHTYTIEQMVYGKVNSPFYPTWDSRYARALNRLGIANTMIKINDIFRNAVAYIEMEIELNLKKKQIFSIISSELRDFLLQSLDPSIIECLSNSELSEFLLIYNAEVNKMRVIKEFNIPSEAVDLIGHLKLGDNLEKFSASVIHLEWNVQRIYFAAAGKYLAHLTNVALFYQSFWINAAYNQERVNEFNRFKAVDINFEIAEDELIAGRKLLNVFKHVKNDAEISPVIQEIKWKMFLHNVSLSYQLGSKI